MSLPSFAIGVAAVALGTLLGTVGEAHSTRAALLCFGHEPTIVGSENGDVLVGTQGPDVIVGGGGRDIIRGRRGRDFICADRSRIVGGQGDDRLQGGLYSRLFGAAGDDRLRGRRSALHGGRGDDALFGASSGALPGPGDDRMPYLPRGEVVYTGAPRSMYINLDRGVARGYGRDVIPGDVFSVTGSAHADVIIGNDAAFQRLEGGSGDDTIYGRAGYDAIHGGDGHDVGLGGRDVDYCYSIEEMHSCRWPLHR